MIKIIFNLFFYLIFLYIIFTSLKNSTQIKYKKISNEFKFFNSIQKFATSFLLPIKGCAVQIKKQQKRFSYIVSTNSLFTLIFRLSFSS